MSTQNTGNHTQSPPLPENGNAGGQQGEDIPVGDHEEGESEHHGNLGEEEPLHIVSTYVAVLTSTVEDTEEKNEGGANINAEQSLQAEKIPIAERICTVTTEWIKKSGEYPENEAFFPLPIVTFALDAPNNITCRICRVSELHVTPQSLRDSDNTPAIMPCGHIAGATCLAEYLDSMDYGTWDCPFCRVPLVHPGCGHRVREKILTWNMLGHLPRTVPTGGVVPGMCLVCRERAAVDRWNLAIRHAQRELTRVRGLYFDVVQNRNVANVVMEKVRQLEMMMQQSADELAKIRAGLRSW